MLWRDEKENSHFIEVYMEKQLFTLTTCNSIVLLRNMDFIEAKFRINNLMIAVLCLNCF